MKKILCLILVGLLSLSLPMETIVMAEEVNTYSEIELVNKIMNEISIQNNFISFNQINDIKIVNIKCENEDTYSLNNSIEKAIQLTEYDESAQEFCTYIITPYTLDKNKNELVNTFAYASKAADEGSTTEEITTDCYFYARVKYTRYAGSGFLSFYRQTEGLAYWTGSNTSITCNVLRAEFQLSGQLFKYPDCLGSDPMGALIQDFASYTLIAEESGAAKDQPCYNYNEPISSDRVFRCPNIQITDGLNIWMYFSYTVDGSSKSWSRNYQLLDVQ